MDKTIITWSIENWITVFLMAIGGFVIVKALVTVISKYNGGSATDA